MVSTYFRSSVVRLGDEASAMIDGGVFILFAEPVPEELAEVSIIHQPSQDLVEDVQVGDTLVLGDAAVSIMAAGDRASENMRTLGHMVIYANPDESQAVLPGAIHIRGALGMPASGAPIELRH